MADTGANIKVEYKQVLDYLNAIQDKRVATQALIDGFKGGTLVFRIFITENLTGRLIGIQTGALRRSAFIDEPKVENGAVTMTYGSRGVPYAAIHEFGGRAGVNKSVNLPERRMFRDAAERALDGIVAQVGIHAIKRLKEAN